MIISKLFDRKITNCLYFLSKIENSVVEVLPKNRLTEAFYGVFWACLTHAIIRCLPTLITLFNLESHLETLFRLQKYLNDKSILVIRVAKRFISIYILFYIKLLRNFSFKDSYWILRTWKKNYIFINKIMDLKY